MAKIRSVVVEGNRESGYKRVQVLFGTNYFLEIVDNDGPSFKASCTNTSARSKNAIRKARSNRNKGVEICRGGV
jgi:hypothetical protein